MARRVFVWAAHPRAGSLCEGLAQAYADGARDEGADVRLLKLSEMAFDVGGFAGYGAPNPPLEPSLQAWQEATTWCEHMLWVHPYWWGAMPAQAKAVLDRALVPGFGFKYRDKGLLWDKLLTGRSADVIITSDTPPLWDTLVYGRPGRRVARNQVLSFCGVRCQQVRQWGPVKTATPEHRAAWVAEAHRMGRAAARG